MVGGGSRRGDFAHACRHRPRLGGRYKLGGALERDKTAFANPGTLAAVLVSVWNTVTDPTTAGICDSDRALCYEKPQGGEK